jgi:hypothetical protein
MHVTGSRRLHRPISVAPTSKDFDSEVSVSSRVTIVLGVQQVDRQRKELVMVQEFCTVIVPEQCKSVPKVHKPLEQRKPAPVPDQIKLVAKERNPSNQSKLALKVHKPKKLCQTKKP